MPPTSSADQEWQFDKFSDGGSKGTFIERISAARSLLRLRLDLILKAQLKRYTRFLHTHKNALKRIEDALGSNVAQTWEFDLNPAELKVRPDCFLAVPSLFVSLVFTLRTSASARLDSYGEQDLQ